MSYVELNLKSAYSLLYGVHRPETLLDVAKSSGYRRVALTDINGLYGVPAFIEAARERGIRPIIGTELRESELRESEGSADRRGGERVVALAKNRDGFGDLCQLLTESRRSGFRLSEAIERLAKDLILVSDSASLLESLRGRVPALYAAVTFGSQAAVPLARRRGLPLAVLGDAVFLSKDDMVIHRVLRAIALNKTVGSLGSADFAASESCFRAPEAMERRLDAWPEALRNTERIADECAFDRIFDGFVFPSYRDGGDRSAAAILRERTLAGAEKRYGELPDAILERIDYELDIIEKKGFADYFLVVDDIVALASRTCGRGSAAASIVSYALGLTNVDPIAYKLYFERFLNPSRSDPPDIDIDFAWDERDALIKAVIDRFGPEHCARVANHNLFRYRSALRETAKAYGLGDGEISARERERRLSPDEAGADPLWTEIRAVAEKLVGLPRGLGMHCGGLVVTPGPICRHCPTEKSAEGYPLLAWEKEGVEAAGLVKIDLLGNRSLAVIRDALENLEEQGIPIDPALWRPADDPATVAALARGDSLGVFYIESPAMRQLQKKTGAGDFDHIVIHSSIIRPAANRFIAEYVRRLHGEPYEPLHPLLGRILAETYGILCYQEDVSKTAVALAGFDEAEADKLRKIIAKKAGSTKLAEYETRFAAGCRERGVDDATVAAVWAMMLSFSGYSFCKPHSASYAMVSFQSAYLRVHHGAAFMAAVLSNRGGFYTPAAYISEIRRMGLSLEGPDVRSSRYRYYARGETVVVGLQAIGELSRTAADAIVAERETNGAFRDLPDLRRRVRLSRDDCLALVDSGALDGLSALSRASAGRAAGGGIMLRRDQARLLLTDAGAGYGSPGSDQGSLSFGSSDAPLSTKVDAPIAAKAGASVRSDTDLAAEYRSLGFLRERHPLQLWRGRLVGVQRLYADQVFPPIDGSDHPIADRLSARSWRGRNVTLLGWPVTQKEVLTVEGRAMDFVSFEDETALFETVLFPDVYDQFRRCLYEQRPFWLKGKIEDDQGARYLNIASMTPL